MFMRNNKGFTLVELLVVIVVMGIITGISIPLIRNIQTRQEMKKYTTYMDGLGYSAKLYVDSYGEDLFGREPAGCKIITYEELESKRLIKDIQIRNVSCKSEDTFVRVVKFEGQYTYTPSIGCGQKSGNTVNVTTRLPNPPVDKSEACTSNGNTIITLTSSPESSNSINKKRKAIKTIIESFTGVNVSQVPIIEYGFSKNKDDNIIGGTWTRLPMPAKLPGGEEQRATIAAGNPVRITSPEFKTPEEETGDLWLVLKVTRLQDLLGRNWTKEEKIYEYLGTFRVDNEKPTFNDSKVISSTSGYNNLKPKLDLKVTDNYSKASDMKMCVSFDSDTCKKTTAELKKYEKYDKDKVLDKISETYDGSSHKIYVTVVDAALNYDMMEFTYTTAIAVHYKGNNNTSGSMDSTYCNVNTDCTIKDNEFLRDFHQFTSWNTKASGSDGETYTVGEKYKFTSSINLYAQWRKNIITMRYYTTGATSAVDHSKDNEPITGGYTERANEYDVDTWSVNGLPDYHNTDINSSF